MYVDLEWLRHFSQCKIEGQQEIQQTDQWQMKKYTYTYTHTHICIYIYLYRWRSFNWDERSKWEALALFSVGPTPLPKAACCGDRSFFQLGGRKPCRGMAQLAIEEPNVMYFLSLEMTSNSNLNTLSSTSCLRNFMKFLASKISIPLAAPVFFRLKKTQELLDIWDVSSVHSFWKTTTVWQPWCERQGDVRLIRQNWRKGAIRIGNFKAL